MNILAERVMSSLRYLCLFANSGVQQILCFCCVFLRLVWPMLSVSLDCPFLIAPSVFSNVYLVQVPYLLINPLNKLLLCKLKSWLATCIYNPNSIRKEMLLIRISGQSRFELSFIFLMLLSLRKGLVGSLHYYQC